MLPLLALLLFVVFGIGALTVDSGVAFSEQARLDTMAEMMAAEAEYAARGPMPEACRQSGDEAACRRRVALTPMLTDLGGLPGSGRDRALDGAWVDPRGARLGDLSFTGVLEQTAPEIVLERRSPLFFGWGAVPAIYPNDPRPDLLEIQDARRQEGISPHRQFSNGRLPGFSLEATEPTPPPMSLALRVGPLCHPTFAEPTGTRPGAVGIALYYDEVENALGADGVWWQGAQILPVPSSRGRGPNATRNPYGYTFAVPAGALAVGSGLPRESSGHCLDEEEVAGGMAVNAYVPVIGTRGQGGSIVAFLAVELQRSGQTFFLRPMVGEPAFRNSSAAPGSEELGAMAQALETLGYLTAEGTRLPSWADRMAMAPR